MNQEPLTLDEYQKGQNETSIYPRVFTEQQVRSMLVEQAEMFTEVSTVGMAIIEGLMDQYTTPFNRLVYPVLGLLGEAGEFANKLKKIARDKGGEVDPDTQLDLADELGDILWYESATATELELRFGEVGDANLAKLRSRRERGVLGGSGDKR